ncbi:hypothetical protein FOZ62_018198 [Perkinsus olseni]|uniref:Mei2-like C-terminal RNA recognition motif domain-containing protein n=1 Tax=Perkinsus olseni TaxID=32597 RepID=A0A7J6UDY8_PEROL|nr:hypothetical protein FOZ62_018198 [Perkinsus olseni]
MDTAKLVDGLKYRLFVLTHHVEVPQDHRFADLLRAFLLGMKWESYDYEYMCRLFPHARNRNTDYSVCLAVAKGFAKIQDLPDYVYSIMYCNLSETPQNISWISLKNDHYSRVFLEVCSPTCKPYRYGMNRETYEAYKVATNPENRGNFLEAWLSFVLPQLNDWGSCIMLYVLMMRFQDGSAAVREVALNLKSSSVDGTSLKTVRDPAEQDPEGLMWDSQVRHTIVNLFKEGVLVPQRSWWLRWLWRSFHGVGSAIDVRAVPSFNAAKLDVSRSQGFRLARWFGELIGFFLMCESCHGGFRIETFDAAAPLDFSLQQPLQLPPAHVPEPTELEPLMDRMLVDVKVVYSHLPPLCPLLGVLKDVRMREAAGEELRNVPSRYTQGELMQEISFVGFEGKFDFFYLPLDRVSMANAGNCFINFTTAEDVSEFFDFFTTHPLRLHQEAGFGGVLGFWSWQIWRPPFTKDDKDGKGISLSIGFTGAVR